MKLRVLMLCAVVMIVTPSTSFGQADSRVVVIPSAVIAFQPADKTYGSPYLEDYLGGIGWGGSLTVLAELKNFVVGAEINSARHSKVLTGRLVGPLDAFHSPIPTRLSFQESFVSALLGYSISERNLQVLGGPAITLGTPQLEGFPRDPDATQHWFVLTGGINWMLPSSRKIQFALGARYFHVFEKNDQFSGIGLAKSGLRANVGVSFGSAR